MLSRLYHSLTLAVTILLTALIAVACTPASLQSEDPDTVSLYFGHLEAKAINTNVYDVSGSASFGTAQVDSGIIDNFYWAYTAIKKDNYFKFGEQTSFAPVVTGAGLDKSFSFSKGQWEFTLKAFASAEDRVAGSPAIYEGTQVVNVTGDANINIPMNYCYESGTGTVNFAISVYISQEELSTIGNYEITKVRATAGELTTDLTADSTKTSWTGSIVNVPNGLVSISYEVYVASETEPRATASKTAIVMTNLETNVKGTATISLTGANATVSFGAVTPDKQPPLVGDIYQFGTVPVDNTYSTAGAPVKWKVLDVDKEREIALVMSVDPISFRDPGFKSSELEDVYYKWSQTSLYNWLNNTNDDGFLKMFGLEDVPMVSVTRQTTPDSSMEGCVSDMTAEETNELVSVLSCAEFSSYLGIEANNMQGTKITKAIGAIALDGVQRTANYSYTFYVVRDLIKTFSNWATENFGLATFPVFWLDYNGVSKTKATCQVTYDLNGGSFSEDETVITTVFANTTCPLPSPTLAGDTFVGWKVKYSNDDTTYTDSYYVSTDVTLAAVYEKANVYAGETIELGSYNGTPVKYIVLDVDTSNSRALVTSKDCVASTPYGAEYNWTTSNINSWLNSTADTGFVKMFGLSNVSMASVEHTTKWDDSTETTSEKIFLLSSEEMNRYENDNNMTTMNILITSEDSVRAGLGEGIHPAYDFYYNLSRDFLGQHGSMQRMIMQMLVDSVDSTSMAFNAAFWMNL